MFCYAFLRSIREMGALQEVGASVKTAVQGMT